MFTSRKRLPLALLLLSAVVAAVASSLFVPVSATDFDGRLAAAGEDDVVGAGKAALGDGGRGGIRSSDGSNDVSPASKARAARDLLSTLHRGSDDAEALDGDGDALEVMEELEEGYTHGVGGRSPLPTTGKPPLSNIGDHDDDGHDFHGSLPHQHGAGNQPKLSLHSLWVTPVLDLNLLSQFQGSELDDLVDLAMDTHHDFVASLEPEAGDGAPQEPKEYSVSAFIEWQLADWQNNLQERVHTDKQAQALLLLRTLFLEAAEVLLLSAGIDDAKGLGNALDDGNLHVWATVHTDSSTDLPTHTHPGSAVTGVFYASVPDGSGSLTLQDPRRVEAFRHSGFEVDPRAGDLIVFPAWLEHSVAASSGDVSEDNPRVSFSFVIEADATLLADVSFTEGTDDPAEDLDPDTVRAGWAGHAEEEL